MSEFFACAARGRNAWWRYLISGVAAIVFATLALTALSIVLGTAHILPPDVAAQLQQPRDAPIFFLGMGIVFGALAVGLMAAVFLFQRKRPGDIIGSWRWRRFFWGFGVWAGLQCVLALIDFLVTPHGFSVSVSSGTAALAISALAGLSAQTFAEEFIFRGYITQGVLLVTKRALPAAIISGLIFGALHIPNGVPQAINAVVFGIVCALIAIRTGGICLSFGVHLVNNFFGAVILVSTGDVFRNSPGLFTQNTPQLLWSDLGLTSLALLGLLWLVLRDGARWPQPAGKCL
jgi:membrane protease YdiL (CAAX protease family)